MENYAVVITAEQTLANTTRIETTLDFVKANSKEEAIGIAYDWSIKKFKNNEGWKTALVQAKQCPK